MPAPLAGPLDGLTERRLLWFCLRFWREEQQRAHLRRYWRRQHRLEVLLEEEEKLGAPYERQFFSSPLVKVLFVPSSMCAKCEPQRPKDDF
jgi:hypothetical protein